MFYSGTQRYFIIKYGKQYSNVFRGRHFSRIGWIGAIGAGFAFWSDWIGAFGVGFGAPIAPIYPGILSGQKENLEQNVQRAAPQSKSTRANEAPTPGKTNQPNLINHS